MSASPVVNAFPRRRLALATSPARKRRRALYLLLSLLLFAPSLYWGSQSWQRVRLRADLRDHGVEAAEVMKSAGECTYRRSRLTGREEPIDCSFTLTYRLRPEEGGAVRTADVHLEGRAPIFTPPARYDPADPGRVMLQPEIDRDMTWSELIGPLVLLLLPAFALLVWFGTGRRGLAKAAARPDPLIVPIEKAVRQMPANLLTVHFLPPGAAKPMACGFPGGEGPLLVRPPAGSPPDQQWALALRAPGGRVHLLDAELAWLDLSDAERAAIRAAAWA